jgi:hypothetical protein
MTQLNIVRWNERKAGYFCSLRLWGAKSEEEWQSNAIKGDFAVEPRRGMLALPT